MKEDPKRVQARRLRLAKLADEAAAKATDPAAAAKHRRTAEVMRVGAKLAVRHLTPDRTVDGKPLSQAPNGSPTGSLPNDE